MISVSCEIYARFLAKLSESGLIRGLSRLRSSFGELDHLLTTRILFNRDDLVGPISIALLTREKREHPGRTVSPPHTTAVPELSSHCPSTGVLPPSPITPRPDCPLPLRISGFHR